MKKNKFIVFAAVALMGISSYFGYRYQQSQTYIDGTSSLMLANIEALTNGETIVEKIPCNSSFIMEPLEKFVYCLTCDEHSGHPTGGNGECTNIRQQK